MMRAGIVGLGKMGSALALRLMSNGYPVSVWNRSPGRAEALIGKGATQAASLEALVASSDAVIVMLWGDDAAREISLGQVIPAARRDQLVIEMSTLSPGMYETLENAALQRGVAFLATPVLGSVGFVEQGKLTVLAGGQQAAFERGRELLESLGTAVHTGSVRASGYLKLSCNTILAVMAETLGELLRLCDQAGVERRLAVELLTGTFARAAASKTQQLLDEDTKARFSLDALLKDVELAHASARTLGVSMPVLETVLPELQAAAARGLGDHDYIAVALEGEIARAR